MTEGWLACVSISSHATICTDDGFAAGEESGIGTVLLALVAVVVVVDEEEEEEEEKEGGREIVVINWAIYSCSLAAEQRPTVAIGCMISSTIIRGSEKEEGEEEGIDDL